MSKQKRPERDCNTSGPHANRKGSHANKRTIAQNEKSVKRRRGSARMDQEQLQKPGYWAVLPAAVRYDPELPPNAKILYAEISSLTDQCGFCFASNAYFMALYGMGERTVTRLITALQRHGYIRVENGDGGAGRRKIYAGVNPLSQNPAKNGEVAEEPRQKWPGNPAKNGEAHNNNKKDNNNPQSPQGGESEIWDKEAFDRFWARYPKKKDKAKAIREWNKLKADRKLMKEMSAALGKQIASEEWQRDNGRAIPYPCRWLSHRRWEDELDVNLKPVSDPDTREDGPVWI